MNTMIKKETIGYYRFPNKDVLTEEYEQSLRKRNLQRALLLGNGFKHKVKITFYVKGRPYPMSVETTVWSVDDQHVFLKGGIVIPVKSIESIQA